MGAVITVTVTVVTEVMGAGAERGEVTRRPVCHGLRQNKACVSSGTVS